VGAQLGQVVREECVVAVVLRRPLADAREQARIAGRVERAVAAASIRGLGASHAGNATRRAWRRPEHPARRPPIGVGAVVRAASCESWLSHARGGNHHAHLTGQAVRHRVRTDARPLSANA